MNGKKKMKSYDEAFKRKAMDLVTIVGRKASDVERELGIYPGGISSWISASKENAGTAKEDHDELRKLKREMDDLRMENEILKKAMGFLAKSQR